MNREQQVTAIAEAFAEVMRQWLSKAEFAEMKRLNETPEFAGPVCASHNYCDANMAMAAAFEQVTERPLLPEDDSGMTEADCSLWNDAWTLARKLYLGSAS